MPSFFFCSASAAESLMVRTRSSFLLWDSDKLRDGIEKTSQERSSDG